MGLFSCSVGKRTSLYRRDSIEQINSTKYSASPRNSYIAKRTTENPSNNPTPTKEIEIIEQHHTKTSHPFKDKFSNTKRRYSLKKDLSEVISKTQNTDDKNTSKKKLNFFGLGSFLAALLSFFIFPAILALILGAIAIRQDRKHPDRYKYRVLTFIGMVIGFVGCIIGVLYGLIFYIFSGIILISVAFLAILLAELLIMTLPVKQEVPEQGVE